jgi:hypothetical protein
MLPFNHERKIMQKMSLQQARAVNGGFSLGGMLGFPVTLVGRATSVATGLGAALTRLFH